MGVAEFNDACRTSVLRYTDEWRAYVTRQARWVDFDHDYKTLDLDYMESVMWAFRTLWDKGLVYSGFRVLWYCWRCETPLSSTETKMDDVYTDRQDPAVTVGLRLRAPGSELDGAYARELGDDPRVLRRLTGADLLGTAYVPPFDFFEGRENAHRVLAADYVTTDDGTGLVHIAPAFGEEDKVVTDAAGIEAVVPVGTDGTFDATVPPYEGMLVFDANKAITRDLREAGLLLRLESYEHPYPHCWRCDQPLIYRAVSSWFVKVTQFRDRMLELNQEITWVP